MQVAEGCVLLLLWLQILFDFFPVTAKTAAPPPASPGFPPTVPADLCPNALSVALFATTASSFAL